MNATGDAETMTVLCAWCGAVLQRGGKEISHGICASCSRKVESRAVREWPTAPHRSRRPRVVAPSLPLPGFAVPALEPR